MNIQEMKIEDLIPYENNPRVNDKAIDQVANSIKEFGFKVPIVVDKNNVIVAGHTRLKASKKLGLDTVPVIIADDLTDEQIKAFRLADNKVSELSDWDFEKLESELLELANIDMEAFGFDEIERERVSGEHLESDEDNNTETAPISIRGQIYQLGKHRLMCGDSANLEDVLQLMCDCKCDLLLTDPPYNVAVSNSKGMTIENDDLKSDEFNEFLDKCFYCASEVMRDGASFYIWHASSTQRDFENALNKAGLEVRQQIIWVKNQFNLGRQDYQWRHEPCFYGWKDGKHYFHRKRNKSTVIDDSLTLETMDADELRELIKSIDSTVIYEDKPTENTDHPTMKPIPLMIKQIQNSSRVGDKVLDLFGGSGSTLIACEELNRQCYMMEYDPKYIDVIIRRWEQFTGQKAVLLNGDNQTVKEVV